MRDLATITTRALLPALALGLVSCSTPASAPAPAPTAVATPVRTLRITPENAKAIEQIGSYSDLEVLSISCVEDLQALPESIGQLSKLRELRIDNGNGCSMNPVLPETMGNLHSLETLVLYGAQDPREAGAQPAQRHKFPGSMSQLKNLTHVDLGRNGLEEIPSFVKDLPKLREFGFAWNMKLKRIPPFMSSLRELTTLNLDANDLHDLPDFLATLPKLTKVSLGDNCAITQNEAKKAELQKRFPKVTFDFVDEYDCPATAPQARKN